MTADPCERCGEPMSRHDAMAHCNRPALDSTTVHAESGSTVHAELGSTVHAWSGSIVYAEDGSTVIRR